MDTAGVEKAPLRLMSVNLPLGGATRCPNIDRCNDRWLSSLRNVVDDPVTVAATRRGRHVQQ